MREQPFAVRIAGGELRGHCGGGGPPALVLHGGAAIPDYTDGLATELGGLFSTSVNPGSSDRERCAESSRGS